MRLEQRNAFGVVLAVGIFGLSVAVAAAAPSAGPCRLAEIKVELAWLADPATFPCQLAVRVNNGALEIGGMVHGEQLHKRVLRLAGEHGRLPVRDKLIVLPGDAPRQTARDNNPQLCRAATAAMSRLTAGQATNYEVAADANGQLVVSGCIPSCEEKLKISRHLSQLPGCTSVVNNLVVGKMIREGQVHTVVSADCRLTVPGEPSALLPPMQAAPPTAPAVVTPEIITPSTPTVRATFKPVQPAKGSPYTSQIQNSAPPANQYGGATAMAAAEPRYSPPVSQQPVIYQQAVAYTPPVRTPTAIARNSTYGGSFNSVPPPKKPLPSGANTATNAAGGSVQPAVAKVAALRPASVTPVQVSSQEISDMVKQRIETVFRGAVRDVNVKVMPGNQLQIKLHVVRAAEGQAIGKQILNLPELAAYKVDLQVPLQ